MASSGNELGIFEMSVHFRLVGKLLSTGYEMVNLLSARIVDARSVQLGRSRFVNIQSRLAFKKFPFKFLKEILGDSLIIRNIA